MSHEFVIDYERPSCPKNRRIFDFSQPSIVTNPLLRGVAGEFYEYQVDPPSEIIPNPWLGNYSHAYSAISSNIYKFNHIFNIGVIKKSALPFAPHTYIDVEDTIDNDISVHFPTVTEHIHQKLDEGCIVYVHCYVGMSRSPTIIIAYLIRYHGMELKEALDFVKDKRKMSNPNIAFRCQLAKWEKICRQKRK